MNIVLNTECVNSLEIDGKLSSIEDLDYKITEIVSMSGIDLNEYVINNKYLRAVQKIKGKYKKIEVEYEYHFLEKPAGINTIYCVGSDFKKKQVKINMPNTVMIVKLLYLNGKYIKIADRLFHTEEPIKKDLSNVLYEWGLSNVYSGTFHICWGHEKLPTIDNQTSYQYIDEFFLGVNNNDLLRNKDINWSKMNSTDIHQLNIKKLPRLTYRLNGVIGINEF